MRTDLSGTSSDDGGNTTRTLRADLRAAPADAPRPVKPKVGLPAGGVPGFAVAQRIGAGGMGQVYEATRESDGRAVALKLLRADIVADPEFRERFQREATVMQQVSHPNVVGYVDAGETDGWLYLATELMRDGDLDRYLKRRGQLFEKDALTLLLKVTAGVGAIHAAGLVHRDLKPQNIFLDHRAGDGGDLKVGDLGMARHESGEDRMTMTGTACGTPAYMAPEQLRGESDIDPRADLYALGVMLYTLLAGREPFIGDTAFTVSHAALKEQAPDLRRFCQVSDATVAIVRQAMRKDRKDRYASAADLHADCQRALAGERPLHAGLIDSAPAPVSSSTTMRAGQTTSFGAAPTTGGLLDALSGMGPLFKIIVIGIPVVIGLTLLPTFIAAPEKRDRAAGQPSLQTIAPALDGHSAAVTITAAQVPFALRWVPPGAFTMGSPLHEPDRVYWEGPRQVTLRQGFWMLAHEVSNAQWTAVTGLEGSGSAAYPVTMVTRAEADAFCTTLSERLGVTVRLPTEAEWEHACRAGSSQAFSCDPAQERLANDAALLAAWQIQPHDSHPNEDSLFAAHLDASRRHLGPRPVAQGQANAWGIMDSHGNVQEWVQDRWNHRDRWPEGAVVDPLVTVGPLTVVRGGSWMHPPARARSASRDAMDGDLPYPWIGFRFVIAGGTTPRPLPSE